MFKNFKFDPRILLPLLIIASFIYGINSYLENKDKPSISENKELIKKLCNYTNQSNYNVLEQEIPIKDIKEFEEIYVKGKKYIVASNSLEILRVEAVSYSPRLDKVAFVERSESPSGDILNTVLLQDTKTGAVESVYEMKEVQVDSRGEYVKHISDVSFSDDSTMLGITTGESFLIYHLDTKKIETIFEDQRDPLSFGVFAYSIPFSWPINGKVHLVEGYYEGSGTSVYDLKKRTKHKLDYNSYYIGESVLGIYENNLVIIKTDYISDSSQKMESKLYLVNIDTFEEEYLETFVGNVYKGEVTKDGNVYLISEGDDPVSNIDDCINYSHLRSLVRFDIKTKKSLELLKTDIAPSTEGKYKNMMITDFILGSNQESKKIIVTLSADSYGGKYLLDESNSILLTPINENSGVLLKSLDENLIFSKINEQRSLNKTSNLIKNDEICKAAEENLELVMELKDRLPTEEERSNAYESKTVKNLLSLIGIGVASEDSAMQAFLESQKSYFFTDPKIKYGCVKTNGGYVAFTVGS